MARFKMHPFISTMANMLIIFGLVTYATKGVSFGAIDAAIPNMFIPQIGKFPTIILWAAAAVFVVWFIWNKTTFGKNLYAVGGNPEAAAVSGISVFKVTMGAFILAGILVWMWIMAGMQPNDWFRKCSLWTGLGYGCHCSLCGWWCVIYRWYR